jgi:hypothetical protein
MQTVLCELFRNITSAALSFETSTGKPASEPDETLSRTVAPTHPTVRP